MTTARKRLGTNPLYPQWVDDEARQRASVIATRKACIPFLVPHRTEGNTTHPHTLKRSAFGYPMQLNASFLDEILGHLSTAEREYLFGPWVPPTIAEESQPALPENAGEDLQKLWMDATLDGMSWRRFFDETIAEWFLSSLGGFIVADNALPDGDLIGPVADPDMVRPYVSFTPFSCVLDYRFRRNGFDQVRLLELHDTRDLAKPVTDGFGTTSDGDPRTEFEVLYRLVPADEGAALADPPAGEQGELVAVAERRLVVGLGEQQPAAIQAVNYGTIVDRDGQPTLPLIPVRYKRHPRIPGLGQGFFMGLDDIILDAWNTHNETRAAYRDAMMSVDAIRGATKEDMQNIAEMLQLNYRMIGIPQESGVETLGNDATEVTAGRELKKDAMLDWATAVKRRAGMVESRATQSGVSLQSEFAIDLNPILSYTAGWLDEIESETLWILAQLQGLTVEAGETTISVTRNRDFRLEPEGSRILRVLEEALQADLEIPDLVRRRALVRVLETTQIAGKVDETFRDELESALDDMETAPREIPRQLRGTA